MQILEDGSLQCACAIDEGGVFVSPPRWISSHSCGQAFDCIHHELGDELMVLGFECAARRQSSASMALQDAVSSSSAPAMSGVFPHGEQANSLNMNNSFNCLAFRLPS